MGEAPGLVEGLAQPDPGVVRAEVRLRPWWLKAPVQSAVPGPSVWSPRRCTDPGRRQGPSSTSGKTPRWARAVQSHLGHVFVLLFSFR